MSIVAPLTRALVQRRGDVATCPTPLKRAYVIRAAAENEIEHQKWFGVSARCYRCVCRRWHLSTKGASRS